MIKEEVKALWKLCFDDDEEFIDLYFRLRYTNEVNIAIQSGEEVISALQAIPYPMTFCGELIQTAYISGACTHPDYRGNGVMRELLRQTFARLWQRSIPVSILIPAEPWLFDYYTRLGYAPVFYQSEKKVNTETLSSVTGTLTIHTTQYNEKHYQYLNRTLSAHPCCVQHTASDYKVILEALEQSKDYVYVAVQNDRISGLAVAWKTQSSITIDMLLAENKASEQALLYHIYKITKCKEIILLEPSSKKSKSQALGMARIINAEHILSLYAAAHPEEKTEIELFDKQLSANNGFYKIENGSCVKEKEKQTASPVRLTAGELSEKIFAPLQPYMSLMLNL